VILEEIQFPRSRSKVWSSCYGQDKEKEIKYQMRYAPSIILIEFALFNIAMVNRFVNYYKYLYVSKHTRSKRLPVSEDHQVGHGKC
jgi:hypothetical protein